MLRCAALVFAMLCPTALGHAISCSPCYEMWCYAALCYSLLCYAILWYAMLPSAVLSCPVVSCDRMICCSVLRCALLWFGLLCYAIWNGDGRWMTFLSCQIEQKNNITCGDVSYFWSLKGLCSRVGRHITALFCAVLCYAMLCYARCAV